MIVDRKFCKKFLAFNSAHNPPPLAAGIYPVIILNESRKKEEEVRNSTSMEWIKIKVEKQIGEFMAQEGGER